MPFVIPSIRDAVLIVSPIAVYSSRRCEPTLPDMNGPLLRPMPILKPRSKPCSRSDLVVLRQPHLEHLARSGERAVGVVRLRQRRAEDGHQPVAEVRDERAAVREHRVADLAQVAVEQADHLLGVEALGEGREAAQVGEHRPCP